MELKYADDRLPKEPRLAYASFICYRDERDLKIAYENYMSQNPDALTSMKAFLKWAATWDWQKRVNAYDAQEDLFTTQKTRREGLNNSLTAEEVAKELFVTCMEEMKLRKADLSHRDIGKYLDIATKINDRWVKQPEPQTVVNVNQTVNTVDVPDDVLRRLGRKLVEEDEEN